MRVLVITDAVGEHDAPTAASAVAQGWVRGDPGAELAVVPLAAGGEALIGVLARLWDSPVSVLAGSGLARESVVTLARRDGQVAVSPTPIDGGPTRVHGGAAPGATDRAATDPAATDSGASHPAPTDPTATDPAATDPAATDSGATDPAAIDLDHPPDSRPAGRAVLAALEADPTPEVLLLDLTPVRAHDAGAGLLAELGGFAAARERLAGTRLVGVVTEEDRKAVLLGLRGITARRGHEAGTDPARMLALDAELERFAHETAPDHVDQPGAGAAGGCGFAVLALGGTLVTGPDWLAEQVDLDRTLAAADLVVTATTAFDFASRGGPVVRAVASWAETALTPCVVLAATVQISAREARLMGVEASYALGSPAPGATGPRVDHDALLSLSTRVAKTWSGGPASGRASS